MKWADVTTGHEFSDGSKVTQATETKDMSTYSVTTAEGKFVVGEDHILLCNVRLVNKKFLNKILANAPTRVPVEKDVHFYPGTDMPVQEVITKWEDRVFDEKKKLMWLNIKEIYYLFSLHYRIRLVTLKDDKYVPVPIKDMNWEKEKPCFCVSTDTGQYQVCGVIHHNSVTLRNVINHCLTHSDDMKLGLVDLKLSEFSRYKDIDKNRVVGVANTVAATCAMLRMSREIMRKRNQQNSDRDLTDFADFKPQGPTDTIKIFGREFNENDRFSVKVDGQEQEMSAKEILEWMKVNRGKKD